MSLTLEEIQDVLTQSGLSLEQRQTVGKIAAKYEAEKKQDAEDNKEATGGKSKYRYVALVRGPKDLQKHLDAGIYLVAVADRVANPDKNSTPQINVKDHLITCAARQNNFVGSKKPGPKGKTRNIVTWPDLFSNLRPKTMKEVGHGVMKVKTKLPVECIVLPEDMVPFEPVADTKSEIFKIIDDDPMPFKR